MDRDIEFELDAKCDVCGRRGAYDVQGDYYCPLCLSKAMPPTAQIYGEKLPHAERRDARHKNKLNGVK